jgi:hypothetical protein
MRSELLLTVSLALSAIALPTPQISALEAAALAQAVGQWHDDTAAVSAFYRQVRMAASRILSSPHPTPSDARLANSTPRQLSALFFSALPMQISMMPTMF